MTRSGKHTMPAGVSNHRNGFGRRQQQRLHLVARPADATGVRSGTPLRARHRPLLALWSFTTDGTAPTLDITGATADGEEMAGDLATGYIRRRPTAASTG